MKTHRIFLCPAIVALLLAFACPTAWAGGPQWKAGLAREKVTPQAPVFMAGYAARTKPFSKVEQDLYVKVMTLEDNKGKRLVLVTADLIGFPAHVAELICEKLQKKLGLERGQILLNASHTHTGPVVSLRAGARGNMSPGDAQRVVAYTQELQDKVVAAVERSVEKMEPVELSWGTGVVNFVMNRREFTPRGVVLGVNPRGLADRSVPVLRVADGKGKLRAILFGAAAHNTTLGGNIYDITGDYAGYAQAYLEQKFPGVQAMFMLGCAGDANPYPRGTLDHARQHGQALGQEVERVLSGKLQPISGPLNAEFARAELPLQPPPPRQELEAAIKQKRGIHAGVAEQMLKHLDRGEKLPTHYSCPIAVVQFGDDLTLVGLPGEVVVDYMRLTEEALGPNKLWVAGYCNDVFGYLPSKRVLREGGYETRGLISGGVGYFAPEAEDVVVATIRRLAAAAGRKLPE